MNILIQAFPKVIDVNGVEHEINSDFRTCLRIILAYEDDSLTGYEKNTIMLRNLYRVYTHNQKLPADIQAAAEAGVKFLNGGDEVKVGEGEIGLRLFSFSKDARFIFSAFRQTHGIDLETADMHWWKFLAYFMDLGADTFFCNLTGLRKRLKTNKATKEERAMADEAGMKELIDIPQPDNRTAEEKDKEDLFFRLVAEGEKRREAKNG
jgi:hypothetical protein